MILSAIIVFYLFNGIMYLRSQSTTSDEGSFYLYAKHFMQGKPGRENTIVDNSTTPVIVLNLVPRAVEQKLNPGLHKTDWGNQDILRGRYISLLVSVLVILLVYCWAKDLYGNAAGLFAAFLMSFSPSFLSVAGLVTTDGYSVLFLLASFYFMWMMLRKSSSAYFVFFSVTMALSQLVKQSLFHLYILMPLVLLLYCLTSPPLPRGSILIRYLLFFILIQWFVINLGYYFFEANSNLGSYVFRSRFFQSVQNLLPSWLPVPFPKPFVNGLDLTKYYDQLGGGFDHRSAFGKVTILGHAAVGGSFWYYYFVSIFFKTPIAFFILIIWAIKVQAARPSRRRFIQREFFLIMPVGYFLFVLSFFYNAQIGIRHIVFLFPFVCIFCSALIPAVKTNYQKLACGLTVLYLLVSVLYYWRNYFPYTNELIPDKTFAYQYVGASNLEFHQGAFFAADFLRRHPDVHWAGVIPGTGDYLIRTDDYLDVWSRHRYDWITGIRPCGQVGFSNLLIHVRDSDLHR